jgi:Holliday junction resolvase-like predicted endonuclease
VPWIALRVARLDDKDELGAIGESLAERELERRGMRILGRNVRAGAIEVDLVALDRGALVCAEVKTCRGELGEWIDPLRRPGRRVDRDRIERQLCAARFLAPRLGARVASTRVDLIEVWIDASRKRVACVVHQDLRRPPRH